MRLPLFLPLATTLFLASSPTLAKTETVTFAGLEVKIGNAKKKREGKTLKEEHWAGKLVEELTFSLGTFTLTVPKGAGVKTNVGLSEYGTYLEVSKLRDKVVAVMSGVEIPLDTKGPVRLQQGGGKAYLVGAQAARSFTLPTVEGNLVAARGNVTFDVGGRITAVTVGKGTYELRGYKVKVSPQAAVLVKRRAREADAVAFEVTGFGATKKGQSVVLEVNKKKYKLALVGVDTTRGTIGGLLHKPTKMRLAKQNLDVAAVAFDLESGHLASVFLAKAKKIAIDGETQEVGPLFTPIFVSPDQQSISLKPKKDGDDEPAAATGGGAEHTEGARGGDADPSAGFEFDLGGQKIKLAGQEVRAGAQRRAILAEDATVDVAGNRVVFAAGTELVWVAGPPRDYLARGVLKADTPFKVGSRSLTLAGGSPLVFESGVPAEVTLTAAPEVKASNVTVKLRREQVRFSEEGAILAAAVEPGTLNVKGTVIKTSAATVATYAYDDGTTLAALVVRDTAEGGAPSPPIEIALFGRTFLARAVHFQPELVDGVARIELGEPAEVRLTAEHTFKVLSLRRDPRFRRGWALQLAEATKLSYQGDLKAIERFGEVFVSEDLQRYGFYHEETGEVALVPVSALAAPPAPAASASPAAPARRGGAPPGR